MKNNAALLAVRGLRVCFAGNDSFGESAKTSETQGYAVDDVSFSVGRGKTLCLVGESGCGKSVTALSIPRLLPSPPAIIASGEIIFDGQDLAALPEAAMRHIRGNRIGMIFQEPMTSLNPVIRVGDQIIEGLRLRKNLTGRAARDAAISLLELAGIPQAATRVSDFPHQMSGGMRQRVMIAMALACDPALIIADEPTTALDVTIQRQILNLLRAVTAESSRSLLLITHDLGVVRHVADDMAVMYAGRIVENGPARAVLENPAHPYTQGLLRSRPGINTQTTDATPSLLLPSLSSPEDTPGARRLTTIPGVVPGLWDRPLGCRFHPRCSFAFERCRREEPKLFSIDRERQGRCWLHARDISPS